MRDATGDRSLQRAVQMNSRNEVLIREAKASDVAELARLRWDSRVEEQSGCSREAFLRECDTWLREKLVSSSWFMAVAESGSRLSGSMFLQFVEKVPSPGATQRAWGYVTNSFVDPQYRGQGIGEQLLRLVIRAARNRDLEFLIVWPSAAAVAFYRRAGFGHVSEVHVGFDDEPPLELMLPVAVDAEPPTTA